MTPLNEFERRSTKNHLNPASEEMKGSMVGQTSYFVPRTLTNSSYEISDYGWNGVHVFIDPVDPPDDGQKTVMRLQLSTVKPSSYVQ